MFYCCSIPEGKFFFFFFRMDTGVLCWQTRAHAARSGFVFKLCNNLWPFQNWSKKRTAVGSLFTRFVFNKSVNHFVVLYLSAVTGTCTVLVAFCTCLWTLWPISLWNIMVKLYYLQDIWLNLQKLLCFLVVCFHSWIGCETRYFSFWFAEMTFILRRIFTETNLLQSDRDKED